jgi:hypothetical protein
LFRDWTIVYPLFPHWKSSPETWLFTCLFHDIGTIDQHTYGTFTSFEYCGGILVLNILKDHDCPAPQAESVAEASVIKILSKLAQSVQSASWLSWQLNWKGVLKDDSISCRCPFITNPGNKIKKIIWVIDPMWPATLLHEE